MSSNSRVRPLSDTAKHILAALGTYQFLTPFQMQRLGVTGNLDHIRATLRSLKPPKQGQRKDTAVYEISGGVDPVEGKRASLYALTPYGAELLSEFWESTRPIKVRGKPGTFAQDYKHVRSCIDFAILVDQWAAQHGYVVDRYDAYYDPMQKGRRGKRFERNTAVPLPTGNPLVPDAVFFLTSPDGTRRLFVYEFYRPDSAGNARTARTFTQLQNHLLAIEHNVFAEAYGYQKAVRVLVAFEKRRDMELLCERARVHPGLINRSNWFFLTCEEEREADFRHLWQRFDGEVVSLF